MNLPSELYSVAQVRAFEARAIAAQEVQGYALMQRAGAAALRILRLTWPEVHRVAVLCGGGNNGGDGYVLATLLQAAGIEVRVHAVVEPQRLSGDARRAFDAFTTAGGEMQSTAEASLRSELTWGELLVDALLGTGFRAPLRPEFAAAIAAINASGRPVLSLDIPSGLDADTGKAPDGAVDADCTITFVALKQGLRIEQGPVRCGLLRFDALGVALPEVSEQPPQWQCLDDSALRRALPPRARDAHKGRFGHVLLIGGDLGMPGAIRLAAEAALRVGAGLVTVATRPEHAVALAFSRPEVMSVGVSTAADLHQLLERCTVVAIGPGLGRSAWSRALFAAALDSGKPLVIDADALNLLAERGLNTAPLHAVLTPHPGEAARLLGSTTQAVQADRRGALRALCAHGAVAVLKGSDSLVGQRGAIPSLCAAGNPGMAVGGMGDVLTGAIAGILAQCGDPLLAARAGVLAHAQAGDLLAGRAGQRGLMALQLAETLTLTVNRGEQR